MVVIVIIKAKIISSYHIVIWQNTVLIFGADGAALHVNGDFTKYGQPVLRPEPT